jgi:hypothetical protein
VLTDVQRILVDAVHSDDPVARVRTLVDAAPAGALSEDERAWLLAVDADGLRVASLVVRKLRFERAVRGDRALGAEFEAAPERVVAAWRRYERAVPPSAEDASDEAAAFRAWREYGA